MYSIKFLFLILKSCYSLRSCISRCASHSQNSLFRIVKNRLDSSISCKSSDGIDTIHVLPKKRSFLPLPGSLGLAAFSPHCTIRPTIIRIQQFNILADGLAGLNPDQGHFSRTKSEHLQWEYRKHLLLHEITQYDPDIITLQEVDHYYDFFLPELNNRGYVGYFAPKPTSACLEVTNGTSADGCAFFAKSSRLRVVSCESKTLALSIAELSSCGELQEDDKNIMTQNQVALIAVCELVNQPISATNNDTNLDSDSYSAPPIIVGTTHLKSSKSPTGERYRQKGVMQIMTSIKNIYLSFSKAGRSPVVILSGDFNAVADRNVPGMDYDPLTYRAVKDHPLGLRSVYNEDLPLSLVKPAMKDIYTTWKARKVLGKGEGVVKRSIDYIFYMPFKPSTGTPGTTELLSIERSRKDAVVASSSDQIGISSLLRFTVYFFSALIPLTSLISSELIFEERLAVIMTAVFGLFFFERFAEGSIFRPRISPLVDTKELVSSYNISEVIRSISSSSNSDIVTENNGTTIATTSTSNTITATSSSSISNATVVGGLRLATNQPEGSNTTSTSLKNKKRRGVGSTFLSGVASISQQIQPLQQIGRPGIQAVSALDVYSAEDVGEELMPSSKYPSDHLSIAADLQLLW